MLQNRKYTLDELIGLLQSPNRRIRDLGLLKWAEARNRWAETVRPEKEARAIRRKYAEADRLYEQALREHHAMLRAQDERRADRLRRRAAGEDVDTEDEELEVEYEPQWFDDEVLTELSESD